MINEKLMGKRTFDLQSDEVLLKKYVEKQVLEIEIWAINDDNPNRNYSHFVAEDFEKNIPTFINKPILGYFSQGDFKAHEGTNKRDVENDIEYFDNQEQILGFIRANDKVEVREKDGKKWIVTTAILLTRYNYPQIKKIIKDRHKKVSVEVNIEDAYFTDLNGEFLNAVELKNDKNRTLVVINDEGKEEYYKFGTYIEHITRFDLSGITILGSKGGIPIKEGIEGASLSLLDVMEKGLFSRQQQALSFAYQQFDGVDCTTEGVVADKFSKEDKGEMDNQDLNVELVMSEDKIDDDCQQVDQMQEHSADEVNPEEKECNELECHEEKQDCDDDDDEEIEEGKEEECKNSAEEPEQNCNHELEEQECKNCDNNEVFTETETEPATDEVLANTESYSEDLVENAEVQNVVSKEEYDSLLSKYDEAIKSLEECQAALATQENKYADQEKEMERIKEDCDNYLEVNKKYEVEIKEMKEAMFTMIAEKRSEQALELMSQEGLTVDQRTDFLNRCQKGEYNDSFELLKKDVALAYFDNTRINVSRNSSLNDFSAPLIHNTVEQSAPKSRKERMAERVN